MSIEEGGHTPREAEEFEGPKGGEEVVNSEQTATGGSEIDAELNNYEEELRAEYKRTEEEYYQVSRKCLAFSFIPAISQRDPLDRSLNFSESNTDTDRLEGLLIGLVYNQGEGDRAKLANSIEGLLTRDRRRERFSSEEELQQDLREAIASISSRYLKEEEKKTLYDYAWSMRGRQSIGDDEKRLELAASLAGVNPEDVKFNESLGEEEKYNQLNRAMYNKLLGHGPEYWNHPWDRHSKGSDLRREREQIAIKEGLGEKGELHRGLKEEVANAEWQDEPPKEEQVEDSK